MMGFYYARVFEVLIVGHYYAHEIMVGAVFVLSRVYFFDYNRCMDKRIFLALIMIFSVIFIWFLFGKDAHITNAPPKGGTVVAFGDSLIMGVGATSGNDFVSRTSRAIGIPISNVGLSGDTTRAALDRTDEVLTRKPHVVLISLGGNDAIKKIPKEETERNLVTIVRRFQAEGAVTILLGVRGGLLGDPYESMYERVAKQTRSILVPDILDGLFGDARYMSDAVHPNDAGYERIAARVAPIVFALYKNR